MGSRRRAVTAAGGAVAALALVVGIAAWPTGDGDRPLVAAPAFSLPPVVEGGPQVELAALNQGRPVVLNFFASWCAPCREEMPLLVAAAERHAGQVNFVGVDHLDPRDDGAAFLAQYRVAFPAGWDPKGETATAYGLRGLPATVFITADGRVLHTRHGPLDQDALEQGIGDLLARVPTLQRSP